uniref:histidine kinase n=1 Tax=Desulfatirhabdium butyrativorans TaxID=340467 RepID=A0A7C4MLW1_9BACT
MNLNQDSSSLHHVEEIVKAAAAGTELTRQLLAFGRKDPIQMRPVDLNRAVRNMQKMLRRLLRENITIELFLADAVHPIHADINQIEQVVMNLCVNAGDAMPEGGTLTILTRNIDGETAMDMPEAGVSKQMVCLSVRDTGCGMDEETRKRIFEPFFTNKQKGKGTGLGLSTVYGIVRQHGGWIDVHSTPGAGSQFDVYFPKSELPIEGEMPRAEKQPQGSKPVGGKVLVVEDNPSIRSIVCDVLRRNGYSVREASDGLNALQVLSEWGQPIDLLVTDMVMPAMGGKSLAIKLQRQMPKLKVLFMSGYTEERLPAMGKIQPGEAFILKPFPVERFLSAVRGLMQEEAGR